MIEGSCLCGRVAFQADELSGPIGHCHCRTCQKAYSSAFSTTARVDRDHFRWTRGEELLRHFESSPGKRPAGHIWMSHALPWLEYGSELPMFSEGVDGPSIGGSEPDA